MVDTPFSSFGHGLDPEFADKLTTLLSTCRQAGYDFQFSQGLRAPQVQAEYYCKWIGHSRQLIRSKAKMLADKKAPWLSSVLLRFVDIPQHRQKLTGQLPGSGWHQWGLAADCYCYRDDVMVADGDDPCYAFYAKAATKLGLTAGYFFKAKDSGHVQGPSADGADNVYTWSHIDAVMQQRFGEKTTIALSTTDKPIDLTAPLTSLLAMRPATAVPAEADSVPPAAEEGDIVVRQNHVYGPGGLLFGTLKTRGLGNIGNTTIADFFRADPEAFPDVSPSLQRCIQAVSENEGRIEAINTYDNAFLSCGIFQWTAGTGATAGELPGLLALLKTRSAATFETYFGSLGLDVAMNASTPHTLQRGFFVLNATTLRTAASKAVLRKNIWAYRFWRAAHDQEVRRAQIALAMSRVTVFYSLPVSGHPTLKISDCVTSEYGVALLLDQHVNRPSDVMDTVSEAVDELIEKIGEPDPKKWTASDEKELLLFYLTARAKTTMTASAGRAEKTRQYVTDGTLSEARGSFT